ncbi:MAG: helical backbone metal receptor [Candidatus Brocadiia bacterium]
MRYYAGKRYLLIVTLICVTVLTALCGSIQPALAEDPYPISVRDDAGRQITLKKRPQRIVSAVPSVTEVLFELGLGKRVKGVTYHTTHQEGIDDVPIIGGFLTVSVDRVKALDPDLIVVSELQKDVIEAFDSTDVPMMTLKTDSLEDSLDDIQFIGRVFNRRTEAQKIVRRIESDLEFIRQKVESIPQSERKRAMRLMGRDRVMTPGRDSFMNDVIRAAGGIPPQFQDEGSVVPVSKDQWRAFNPQFVYGCEGDRPVAEKYFGRSGWESVDAVENGRVVYFPSFLTCRASTNTGYFVKWLAARMYPEKFLDDTHMVREEKKLGSRPVEIDLPYVEKAEVNRSRIYDFVHKTFLVNFNRPVEVTSTLEGERKKIQYVGNHYMPPPCWGMAHRVGINRFRSHVYSVLDLPKKTASLLFTGADMDNLALVERSYRDMKVYAVVTAGVESNAMRMSRDVGEYYEPGTINVVVLPNMALSRRARARATITATEAKTAALQDMDIRSASQPRRYQATGTGTDNVLVVGGAGERIDNTGGHCKMGELIARAVHEGVKKAVYRQNYIRADRNIFRRLRERNYSVSGLARRVAAESPSIESGEVADALVNMLLQADVASFVERSFALDQASAGRAGEEKKAGKMVHRHLADDVLGVEIGTIHDYLEVNSQTADPATRMTLNTLLTAIRGQQNEKQNK